MWESDIVLNYYYEQEKINMVQNKCYFFFNLPKCRVEGGGVSAEKNKTISEEVHADSGR